MDKEYLTNKIELGMTIAEIADGANKGKTTVRYWLKKHGLKTLNRQGPRGGTGIKRNHCEVCGLDISGRSGKKYCSIECSAESRRRATQKKVELWVSGNSNALPESTLKTGLIRGWARKHLIEVARSRCLKCDLNEWMGEDIPLDVHHIDGDYKNCSYNNLLVVCPNCHKILDDKIKHTSGRFTNGDSCENPRCFGI